MHKIKSLAKVNLQKNTIELKLQKKPVLLFTVYDASTIQDKIHNVL